jgi:ketosteroid isomerase-like protein
MAVAQELSFAGKEMSNALRSFLSVGLLILVAAASCSAKTPSSALGEKPTSVPRTVTPQPASDEEAIRRLVEAEGATVVSQDVDALMDLWADDATITDAKHTPDEANDDATWRGKDAIRARYVTLVFPGNPQAGGAVDVNLAISGETATATSTTRIGNELAPGGDRWTFVRRNGRWWIESLTYNLEK